MTRVLFYAEASKRDWGLKHRTRGIETETTTSRVVCPLCGGRKSSTTDFYPDRMMHRRYLGVMMVRDSDEKVALEGRVSVASYSS